MAKISKKIFGNCIFSEHFLFQIKQTVNQLDAEEEQKQDAARAQSVLDAFAEEFRPREGTKNMENGGQKKTVG